MPGQTHLDVVVETAGPVLVVFEQPEGVVVGKVLKLNEHVGLPDSQCSHELLNEAVILSTSGASLYKGAGGKGHISTKTTNPVQTGGGQQKNILMR